MTAWSLVPIVAGVTYIFLIYTTLHYKPRGRVHQTFFVYLLAITLWASVALLSDTKLLSPRADLLVELTLFLSLFMVVSYYHLLCSFMQKPSRIVVLLGYSVLLALIPLIILNHIGDITMGYVITGVALFSSLVLTGWAGVLLGQYYIHATNAAERNNIRYLLIGFSLALILGLTTLHPFLTSYPLVHFGNLGNALLIAYVMARSELLDITPGLRKALVYVVAGLYCVVLYLAVICGLLQPFDLEISYAALAASAGVTILVAILFYPVRNVIEQWVEHLNHGESYSYRRLLLTFAEKMSNVLELGELAELMLNTINKGIRSTEASLFLPEEPSGDFVLRFTSPTEENHNRRLKLEKDSPIATWLARKNKPLSQEQITANPQMKTQWEAEQFQESNIELLLPIKNKGVLIGILSVGKKLRNTRYLNEDRELLMTMAAQAGVVIQNAQLYAAAKMRANTDELTSLFNHRYFQERIEEEIKRGLRFGGIFSVLLLDLDIFKRYNDIYGHLAGDKALQQIGSTIRNSIRSIDMAFRYGGDEFAVILPTAAPTNVYQVAERIRKNIEETMSAKEILMTCSLGIASWPTDGVTREALLQCADAALYQAKQQGGNRACLATEGTPPLTPPPGGQPPAEAEQHNRD